MPRFGTWAGVLLVDRVRLRVLTTDGVDDFRDGRGRLLKNVPAAHRTARESVRATTLLPADEPGCDPAAFAVPTDVAAEVAAADGVLVVIPLPGLAEAGALLVVAMKAMPSAGELEQLDELARRGATALRAAVVYEDRAAMASTLRAALLPAPLPAVPGVQLGASYRAAQEASQIGGDFYDVMPLGDGRWMLSIGDVCGKGVDAAVLTGHVRQSLRTAAVMTDDPATALRLVNDTLLTADGTTFVTLSCAVLRPSGRSAEVRLSSAGHPPPLLLRGGTVEQIGVRGTLIGMLPEVSFGTVDLHLNSEDVLLFYTDGGPEARGEGGMLGVEPLAAALADSRAMTAQAVTERLLQLVLEHLDGRPHDDIALLAVRCVAGADS